MTEKLTEICLPGVKGSGLAEWGTCAVPEMIAAIRSQGLHWKKVSDAILAASDDDFKITVVRGSTIRSPVKVLQLGRQVTK
jgi:hypothetical protein